MPISTPSDRPILTDPRLTSLYAYWDGKRDGRPMPIRADIDPVEMRSWLGNLLLIDIGEDGRFVYRLYGTKFVDSFGIDMTGRAVEDLPREQQERVRVDYEEVRTTRAPRARLYTSVFATPPAGLKPQSAPQVTTWERLILPLSDESGARVAMLLVGAYPLADLHPST